MIDFTTLFTGINFADLYSGITDLIPILIPAILGFIGVRKGWAFFKGEVKKA